MSTQEKRERLNYLKDEQLSIYIYALQCLNHEKEINQIRNDYKTLQTKEPAEIEKYLYGFLLHYFNDLRISG